MRLGRDSIGDLSPGDTGALGRDLHTIQNEMDGFVHSRADRSIREADGTGKRCAGIKETAQGQNHHGNAEIDGSGIAIHIGNLNLAGVGALSTERRKVNGYVPLRHTRIQLDHIIDGNAHVPVACGHIIFKR